MLSPCFPWLMVERASGEDTTALKNCQWVMCIFTIRSFPMPSLCTLICAFGKIFCMWLESCLVCEGSISKKVVSGKW